MRINRLVEIIIILLNKKVVTAKELAEKLDVSTRTIYRDIEELSLSGIPIYASKGTGGGISLIEEYTINKAMLSQKDKESLMLALSTLKATEIPNIDKVLNKLGAIFKNMDVNDWVAVDFSNWGNKLNSDYNFDDIKGSILEKKIIEFRYINSTGVSSIRKVHPYKLIFKSKEWYLWGFSIEKNDFRIFKLSRIKNFKIKGDTFIRKEVDLNLSREMSFEVINLKLRFSKEVLYKIYDFYDENSIIKNEDGTYDVTVSYPQGEWVYDHILSYGNNVTVLEPKFVRAEIIRRLKETLMNYNF
ncbi:YafY family protein [Clostridium sp. CTA-19]